MSNLRRRTLSAVVSLQRSDSHELLTICKHQLSSDRTICCHRLLIVRGRDAARSRASSTIPSIAPTYGTTAQREAGACRRGAALASRLRQAQGHLDVQSVALPAVKTMCTEDIRTELLASARATIAQLGPRWEISRWKAELRHAMRSTFPSGGRLARMVVHVTV